MSSSSSRAVSMTIGTLAVAGSARSRRVTSRPSSPGRPRSRTTRSGRSRSALGEAGRDRRRPDAPRSRHARGSRAPAPRCGVRPRRSGSWASEAHRSAPRRQPAVAAPAARAPGACRPVRLAMPGRRSARAPRDSHEPWPCPSDPAHPNRPGAGPAMARISAEHEEQHEQEPEEPEEPEAGAPAPAPTAAVDDDRGDDGRALTVTTAVAVDARPGRPWRRRPRRPMTTRARTRMVMSTASHLA